MIRQSKVFHSLALLPVAGAFALTPGGGAQPGAVGSSLGMSLSSSLVTWGSPVTASGRAPALKPGSSVRVVLRSDRGSSSTVATARVDRRHAWRASFRARQEGSLIALSGRVPARSAAVGSGQRIDIALGVATDSPVVGGRRGSRVRVSARVMPATGTRWVLERRSTGGWRKVSSGRSSRSGRISASVTVGSRPVHHRFRVEPAGALAGNTSRSFRSRLLRPAVASWYSLYGEGLACGGVLRRGQLGVAHKTLPCGTKVTIRYRGRTVTAPVIDRGPFIAGREFDLSGAVAKRLGFDGVGTVWVSP